MTARRSRAASTRRRRERSTAPTRRLSRRCSSTARSPPTPPTSTAATRSRPSPTRCPHGAPGAEVERTRRRLPRLRVGDPDRRERQGPPLHDRSGSGSLSARRWRRPSGCGHRDRDPAGELIARARDRRPPDPEGRPARDGPPPARRAAEGVAVVIGEAGTGKTYATVAAAEGWAQAGIELRAAAPTWRAANVLRAEGLPATEHRQLARRRSTAPSTRTATACRTARSS